MHTEHSSLLRLPELRAPCGVDEENLQQHPGTLHHSQEVTLPGLLGHHGKHTRGWTAKPGVQPQLCGQCGCSPGTPLPSLSWVRTQRVAQWLFTNSRHSLQEGPSEDPPWGH